MTGKGQSSAFVDRRVNGRSSPARFIREGGQQAAKDPSLLLVPSLVDTRMDFSEWSPHLAMSGLPRGQGSPDFRYRALGAGIRAACGITVNTV
jgi:hypothetical protein